VHEKLQVPRISSNLAEFCFIWPQFQTGSVKHMHFESSKPLKLKQNLNFILPLTDLIFDIPSVLPHSFIHLIRQALHLPLSTSALALLFETDLTMVDLTMIDLTSVPLLASFLCIASLWTPMSAKRPFNRRSDLEGVPPVSDSCYEVPLVGSETCALAANCMLIIQLCSGHHQRPFSQAHRLSLLPALARSSNSSLSAAVP
jgi:hypothetical protein